MTLRTHLFNISLFLKKYYTYILLAIGVLIVSFIISAYTSLDKKFKYMNYLINQNIEEYNETDLEHICSLTRCDYIFLENKDKYSIFKKEDFLRFKGDKKIKIYQLTDIIYLYNTKLLIYNKKAKAFISINYKEEIKTLYQSFMFLFILFTLTLSYLLFKTFRKERNEAMVHMIGNEAILANKSMIVITENVHHELNTPIEVIDNKVTKIHKTLKKYMEDEYNDSVRAGEGPEVIEQRKSRKKVLKLEKDFDFMKTSFEQIFAVLNKMKNFKSLRYSNGNKTVYDIIDGAFRIIAVSNPDFEYNIDINFKKYKIVSEVLKNIDLLNVLINHLKNSLEANANLIEVKSGFSKSSNKLKIMIYDNGTGIPERVLKYIFEPNFSTKQIGDSIRGNGMYLNQYIVQQAGGNISVKNREPRGAIVTLTIPSEERIYE